MQKFKKGDEVVIISGADKKKIGKILTIKGDKVVVEGVGLKTIHKKPTQQEAGKIVKIEKPIHISNISHIEDGKPVKIKFVVEAGEGKAFTRKSRISKKTSKKI